ncbi:MAG: hypothetical protein Q7R69_01235 [bacterium]|nr:hypothetical protein [bacterium]
MKKYFPHISAFILTLVLVFAMSGFLFPQIVHAGVWDVLECTVSPLDCALRNFVSFVVGMILKLVSLLTGLAGIILNGVIFYTVVDVSNNYAKIPAISKAWEVIRDVANMGFIFVLLYAAIKTILGIGSDVKKLIVNIIVVAILINFSLFFTKIVIDISNILALFFYEAIAPGALESTNILEQAGLSNAFMQYLSLQSLYKVAEIKGLMPIITIGIMGSIMLLIASFIFFAVAIMFIIRYVVLILVLILSPIAFMSFVLPELKKYRDQWWNALSGQAFFAPIYFMLTWVTLVVLGGVIKASSFGEVDKTTDALGNLVLTDNGLTSLSGGAFAMFINFVVIIVFLITSLIIAKEWSNKAGPGVSGLTKWAMGAAGGATLGMAGRFGRGTIGRAGSALGESEELKARAAQGGMGGMAARLALATGRRTGKASFDVRGTPIGGQLDAGKAQKGGFAQVLKDRNKKEKEFADSLGPSDALIAEKERAMERIAATERAAGRRPEGSTEWLAARGEVDKMKGVDEKEAIKRIRDEARRVGEEMSEEEARRVVNEDRDRFVIKSIKDERKEERVESLERSPTYMAAETLEAGGRRIAETRPAQAITRAAGRTAQLLTGAGEKASGAIANVTDMRGLRTVGRWAGGAVRGVINAPAEATRTAVGAVREIPNMIKAKNRAAIAEIRKGKKPVKDQLQEILEAEGERPTGGAGATPTGNVPTGDATATPGGTPPTA